MVARKTDPPDNLDAAAVPVDDSTHREQDSIKPNPYVALAEMFADDSFADEVDAYTAAERRRQREEAAARGVSSALRARYRHHFRLAARQYRPRVVVYQRRLQRR